MQSGAAYSEWHNQVADTVYGNICSVWARTLLDQEVRFHRRSWKIKSHGTFRSRWADRY